MTKLQRLLMTWLLLIVGSAMLTVSAQDDFNPGNPPEPDLRLRVSVNSERGYTSGSGTYLSGTKVTSPSPTGRSMARSIASSRHLSMSWPTAT